MVQVGTLEDQLRRLAAKLQGYLLEVAFCGGGHDLAAGDGAARERNLVDAPVASERGTANGAQ